MATIITVPNLTGAEGISPNKFLTFSERSSISPDLSFRFVLFLFIFLHSFKFINKSFSVSQFKLILDQIVICASLFNKRNMGAGFNGLSSINNNNLVRVFDCR